MGSVIHPPAENPLTGEIDAEGYDGFRVKTCDKGRYPWYYQELPREEIMAYCDNNPKDDYCKMLQARDKFS